MMMKFFKIRMIINKMKFSLKWRLRMKLRNRMNLRIKNTKKLKIFQLYIINPR